MGLHEYKCSLAISAGEPPFYAMVMALMRKADTDNAAKLRLMWPDVWEELSARHEAPGGILPTDDIDPNVLRYKRVAWNGDVTDVRETCNDGDGCPGEGKCHGALVWCDLCGDVTKTCHEEVCDAHDRT